MKKVSPEEQAALKKSLGPKKGKGKARARARKAPLRSLSRS